MTRIWVTKLFPIEPMRYSCITIHGCFKVFISLAKIVLWINISQEETKKQRGLIVPARIARERYINFSLARINSNERLRQKAIRINAIFCNCAENENKVY